MRLEPDEVKKIEEAVRLLKPQEEAAKPRRGLLKNFLRSKIIPPSRLLQRQLALDAASSSLFPTILTRCLEKRFGNVAKHHYSVAAMLLDPRYNKKMLSASSIEVAESRILSEIAYHKRSQREEDYSCPTLSGTESTDPKGSSSMIIQREDDPEIR